MLCRIGDIEVWRILEINGPFMPPEDLYPSAGPDVREIIAQHAPEQVCANTGHLILPVQGFLLKTPSHNVLVDSCVGNHKTAPNDSDWNMRSDNRFMAALTSAGVGPDDIDYVMCTHLHIDHVGWNTKLEDGRWVPTFPNARYLIPAEDEVEFRKRDSPSFNESVLPIIEAGQAELVSAGHMLGDHITLVPTPGHTPGHVSVLLNSGGRQAIITGDALHSTVQCWEPDWTFIYDQDADAAIVSRRKLLSQAAESGCVVLGSHFTLPSIGRVKGNGDVFRWEHEWN